MVSFSDSERRAFARNGFLVREDLLSPGLVDDARAAVVDAMDADPDDPEALIGAGYEVALEGVEQAPLTAIAEALFPAAEALVGEGVLAPPGAGMQVALEFPDGDAADPAHGPKTVDGHLDGYAAFDENPEVTTFQLGAAVYFDDVPPRGGGFTVWPGSHRVAAEYFGDHALESVGGKPTNSELPATGEAPDEWDYDRRLHDQRDPYEVAGSAGTVVLWHGLLTHAAGINTGERVRMAGIERFAREDIDDVRRDAASNLFEYWPAMAGVPFVEGGEPIVSE
ncbi:phytanoyl-CoA dioxygenase family protein [Halosimplex rubrum]|uniref:Phytanoyl-CoA dioxygenase family protein n=1 Tax=Halosimplex rubrum TaxID=869889 RepID=A0A7D5P5Y4_9EURY|nr:phytanoyl-CoA dioxygenase family protein [Halosimplex rubrum]QLH78198.1 phytanoyl-CoA dioxygenase family protein [Halosimplex rubrum]